MPRGGQCLKYAAKYDESIFVIVIFNTLYIKHFVFNTVVHSSKHNVLPITCITYTIYYL